MFEICLRDLLKVPSAYTAISGADAWATKVKLPLAFPWLEVVAGEESIAEVYLLSDSEGCLAFATEATSKEVFSITCRSYSQEQESFKTLQLKAVVQLEDELGIRYLDSQGRLRDPLWLELDMKRYKKPYQVLFGVN